MSNLKDLMTQDRRLVILRILASDDVGYRANDSILQRALDAMGHTVSRDQVRMDIAWLAEVDLVDVERVREDVFVAALNKRGADVAAGRTTVPGVKRPGPHD